MRPSDEIFAQIAIRKGYVEPADVERAKQHLRRLGGRLKTVPTLGAVLRRLGSLTRGQLRTVEEELEQYRRRCEKCDTVFYTLDQTRAERCDACMSNVHEPLSLLPNKRRASKTQPPSPEQRNPFARPRSSWQSPAGRARSRASAFYGDLDGGAPPAVEHDRTADPTPSRDPTAARESSPSAGATMNEGATPGSARLRRASAFFSELTDAAPSAPAAPARQPPAPRPASPSTTTAPLDTNASPDLQRRRRAAAFFGGASERTDTSDADAAKRLAEATPFTSVAPNTESAASQASPALAPQGPATSEPPTVDDPPRLQLVLDPVPPPPTALAETCDFASLAQERAPIEGAPTRRLVPEGLEESEAQTVPSPTASPEARATAPTMAFDDASPAPGSPSPETALEVRDELSPEAQRSKEGLEGRVLSGFRVLRLLGKGGMGAVYLAEQLELDRKVALKVLSPRLTRDRRQVEQFFREARALARVEHRNIVTIYHVGSEDDIHFLAMQLVRGGSLAERLRQRSPLPVDEAV
ncbi:MAG: hypothetical protein D6776_03395, partial [Planctomycetota bacterium]